jgi:hypothetical protein
MSYRKVYSYDDLAAFFSEHFKFLTKEYEKINDKNITHPNEQRYKEFSENILEKVTGVARCLGIYVSGKHKSERCQAAPQPNSKYCLNHSNQDTESKDLRKTTPEIFELLKKSEQDPENKELYKNQIIELLRKTKLKDQ